jgi:DNA-binding LacI/PurR family transcriptional regulator
MAGVLAFLAQQGLRVPQDISLFSLSDDDWFPWVEPKISCLRGDDMLMVRRVIRWVEALTKGKQDRTFIGYPVTWDMGGSIGPVP